jgi:hypothetical protein
MNGTDGGSVPLLRAIRGPVVLITLGTLFLLDYAAGIRFWRTWPALLIVLGVVRLLEYISARDHERNA